jgi:hypothetical protein
MMRSRQAGLTGATMVELLLALPVILLLGLGIAQFTLVYQAKHALDYALMQAARQGAVEHASLDSIERGFAAGLVPYLYGAEDWGSLLQAEARARDHVRDGVAAGWIVLRQRSPSRESFDDWAEPALDARGDRLAGLVEIPNDNLDSRRLRMQPASGVAGMSRSEPVGVASGQTLADANILRLELLYGVRMVVPVVGAVVIRTLALWNACPQAVEISPRHERLGLVRLGEVAPAAAGQAQQAWMCGILAAREVGGRSAGRIPLRSSATIRMMSPARRSSLTHVRVDAATGRAPGSSPDAQADDRGGDAPASSRQPGTNAGAGTGTGAGPRGIWRLPQSALPVNLANGFLSIGSDRSYPQPSPHPALCDG